ncbi:integrase/recombinase xerD homolog [Ptychodera flava]|uniref:integrase/recombinase xerD homolog n=1 Tax=Ptychodera flava TaxID=63121 RepID=UPI00396A2421
MSIPLATQQLTELATAYIHNSVAGNTRRTYQVGQKCYMDFCSSHGLATLPVTIRTAILIVMNLANRGLAYRTIKVYLAGVMHHHVERGYADDVTTHALLQRTLQGIRRSIGEVRRPRLPITIDLLRRLKECLRQRADMCSNDKLMVWASFTLAFYGFLRVSEFTARSPTEFDVNATLLARDIVLTDVIEIRIKSSRLTRTRVGTPSVLLRPGPLCVRSAPIGNIPGTADTCALKNRRSNSRTAHGLRDKD